MNSQHCYALWKRLLKSPAWKTKPGNLENRWHAVMDRKGIPPANTRPLTQRTAA